ncbi:MAG: glycine--tRNA ligase subunit beta, partial [Alphaproteobacteria bacterium]
MPDLLVELWCEDLPGWAQEEGASRLPERLAKALAGVGLLSKAEEGQGFATTCRLAVVVPNVREKTPPREEERRGPREGAPEKAIEGFLRGMGLSSLEEAQLRETPKGKFWFATNKVPERAARDVIPEVVAAVMKEIRWQRSMRWEASGFRWPRPLRRYLVMLGAESIALDCKALGLPMMKNGAGETLLATGASVKIPAAEKWAESLRKRGIEPDIEKRQNYQFEQAMEPLDIPHIQPHFIRIGESLIVPALLAESPHPIILELSSAPSLSDDFIDRILGHHLKVIRLSSSSEKVFLYVAEKSSHIDGTWKETVKRGVEGVAKARLADAEFYWRKDQETGLDGLLEQLKDISFHPKLGSMYQRAERIADLSRKVAKLCGYNDEIVRAVHFAGLYAKADLASGSVGEVPYLQGIVGAEFMREELKTEKSGIDSQYHDSIFRTIKEQYDVAKPTYEAQGALGAQSFNNIAPLVYLAIAM